LRQSVCRLKARKPVFLIAASYLLRISNKVRYSIDK
jgi:hypothetical protein